MRLKFPFYCRRWSHCEHMF